MIPSMMFALLLAFTIVSANDYQAPKLMPMPADVPAQSGYQAAPKLTLVPALLPADVPAQSGYQAAPKVTLVLADTPAQSSGYQAALPLADTPVQSGYQPAAPIADVPAQSGYQVALPVADVPAQSGYQPTTPTDTPLHTFSWRTEGFRHGKHIYQVVDRLMSWHEAENFCQTKMTYKGQALTGGHLMSMESPDENDWIKYMLDMRYGGLKHGMWLGMKMTTSNTNNEQSSSYGQSSDADKSCTATDDAWTWTDLTPKPWMNWATGKPDCRWGRKSERCVHLLDNEKWADAECQLQMKFICKTTRTFAKHAPAADTPTQSGNYQSKWQPAPPADVPAQSGYQAAIPADVPAQSGYQPAMPALLPADVPAQSGYQAAIPADVPAQSGYQPAMPALLPADVPAQSGYQPAMPALLPADVPAQSGYQAAPKLTLIPADVPVQSSGYQAALPAPADVPTQSGSYRASRNLIPIAADVPSKKGAY